MDNDRFLSTSATRENPRPVGFSHERVGKPPADVVQRSTLSILDRFRAMIRDWEDEYRAAGEGDETLQPDGREIVRMYRELLTELTFNSKPIITELTIIAGEQREHAWGIAEAVCSRIDEVVQDQKMPALYLLDSIVKNIGDVYVRKFASRLPKTFCQAYREVHSTMHPAMRHLFGTWVQVFPSTVLSKIEDELKFRTSENKRPNDFASIRTSETPHPSHGIHVNPKYLEARHQFERPPAIDVPSSEVSSGKQVSGKRSISNYNDYELDNHGFQPPSLRLVRDDSPREGSPQNPAEHGSTAMGQEGPFLTSQRKVTKRFSPTRIGLKRSTSPLGQRFQRSSPGSMAEADSRSHSGLDFPSHRASEGDYWHGRNWTIDENVQQPTAVTTYNRFGRQRQRELIDTYGNYRGKDTINESFPKFQRVNSNGMKTEGRKMDWQNSEEEEYIWEDMSPTDPSKRNSSLTERSSRNLGLRANSSRLEIISPKSDFRRRSWPVPPLKDSTTAIDGKNAIGDYGLGPMNKMYLNDKRTAQSQHHESSVSVQDYVTFPNTFHRSQDNLSPKAQARPFQLPYLVSGVAPSVKLHGLYDNSYNAEMPHLKLPNTTPNSLNMEIPTVAAQKVPQSLPLAPVVWSPAHKSQPLQLLSMPNNLQMNNKFIDNQKPFSVPFSQQRFERGLFRQAFQETHGGPPVHFAQPLSVMHPQNSIVLDPVIRNSISGIAISAAHNMPIPPLPPGPPPSSSHPIPTALNSAAASHSSVSEFSGLISTLMEQGLISLARPDRSKDIANLEFNAEHLKIRCESTINALYSDLSRQCTTCGLRFKCQEDHSKHMDWHVAKNRISRNRKQKSSRKWFVSAKEWLCGAETVGADAVPGFLPMETASDKNEKAELAVPADENQTVCALCGEPFEDFYSDETEEWMYRGAVYMNAPNGDIEGLDRSQLGPIVHVKCRPDSADGYGQA